jgi:hypothetical protein
MEGAQIRRERDLPDPTATVLFYPAAAGLRTASQPELRTASGGTSRPTVFTLEKNWPMKMSMASLATLASSLLFASALAAEPPGSVLDLSCWKLTLPIDTARPGRPDEITQPQLASFQDATCFFVSERGDSVIFRAHCGGRTSKGSAYPRCELREMQPDGKREAAWGTADGKRHRLTMEAAITKTPPVKRHVVCAQIHDAEDDVLMVRLEGTKLFIERNSQRDVVLNDRYQLGRRFALQIEVVDGRIQVWYDAAPVLDWKTARQACYFKAGCYTQSNIEKGDAADSYGEVAIYRLVVEHR